MGRWTQYDEDSYRLSEGLRRIGYDADSSKYTYIDENGVEFEGVPGETYGQVFPVKPANLETHIFADDDDDDEAQIASPRSSTSPTTFQDFLDPSLFAPSPLKATSSSSAAKMRFVEAVHRVLRPKMYGVVVAAMRARNKEQIESNVALIL